MSTNTGSGAAPRLIDAWALRQRFRYTGRSTNIFTPIATAQLRTVASVAGIQVWNNWFLPQQIVSAIVTTAQAQSLAATAAETITASVLTAQGQTLAAIGSEKIAAAALTAQGSQSIAATGAGAIVGAMLTAQGSESIFATGAISLVGSVLTAQGAGSSLGAGSAELVIGAAVVTAQARQSIVGGGMVFLQNYPMELFPHRGYELLNHKINLSALLGAGEFIDQFDAVLIDAGNGESPLQMLVSSSSAVDATHGQVSLLGGTIGVRYRGVLRAMLSDSGGHEQYVERVFLVQVLEADVDVSPPDDPLPVEPEEAPLAIEPPDPVLM